MIKLAVLAALAVVGCKKQEAGGASDCGSVIPAAVDRVMPELAKAMAALPPEKVAQLGPKTKEILLARCAADRWSADQLACYTAGKTTADMTACDKALPAAARDKLEADLHAAMASITGTGLGRTGGSGYVGGAIPKSDVALPGGGVGSELKPGEDEGAFGGLDAGVDPQADYN